MVCTCVIWENYRVRLCLPDGEKKECLCMREHGCSCWFFYFFIFFFLAVQCSMIKISEGTLMLTVFSFFIYFFIFMFLQLNEMIRAPVEGDFWQVDHIQPVYRGGGQCSLDNLQTLCTVCHKAVRAHVTTAIPALKAKGLRGKSNLSNTECAPWMSFSFIPS